MDFNTKADVMILAANPVDMMDDNGEPIRGCSVQFAYCSGLMYGQSEPDATKSVGLNCGKAWMPLEIREKIRIAPAIYEGEFVMNVDSKGKTKLTPIDFSYKSNLKIDPYVLEGVVVPGMLDPEQVKAEYAKKAGDKEKNK